MPISTSEQNSRSIPSLDGLRALSVFAVILGHTKSALLDRVPFNALFRNGEQGVAVFFVISGFLITHLLVKELKRNGDISLKRFYLRRTLRIFPPFYVFLVVIAILSFIHVSKIVMGGWVWAATYTWNYAPPVKDSWILGHCWSLSLEEQFYLLWPACMAFLGLRRSLWIAAAVTLLSPLSRVVTYYAWPQTRGHLGMMLHTHLDTIMTGCLLSLILDIDICQEFKKLALYPAAPIVSVIFLFFVDTPAARRWEGKYTLTRIWVLLENLATSSPIVRSLPQRVSVGEAHESKHPTAFRKNLLQSIPMAAAFYWPGDTQFPRQHPFHRALRRNILFCC